MTQKSELLALRETLEALDRIEILVRPKLSVPEAEAQLDNYDDHILVLRRKTEAAIEALEAA